VTFSEINKGEIHMAFCANCGSAVSEGTAFCAGCGKPVGGAPHPVAVAQSGGAAVAAQPTVVTAQPAGLTSNVAAALAYILGFITGILFLVLEPYKHDRFVRFHAMQSILYSAAGIVFRIGWSILVGALVDVSGWMALVLVPVGLVISLALFGFWIFLMYQAYSNREFHIPIIGAIAAKQLG
jgi:uncharacterized membrane protein